MKPSAFGIIFAAILVCIILPTNLKARTLTGITNQKIKLDQQFDNAADDAMYNFVETDNTNQMQINKETTREQFFKSLAANLGILDNKEKRELLNVYVPIILITDLDGFYLNYSELTKDQRGEQALRPMWTEKIPFSYEDEKAVYSFFLGDQKDYIRIYDKTENKTYEGFYQDIQEEFNSPIFVHFDEYRRKAIISCMMEKMNVYINNHNKIAEQFGITYNFTLPVIPDTEWDRTIDDISLFLLFQGYPYGANTGSVYNRYVISGARINRKNKQNLFYIEEQEGKKLYHKFGCSMLKGEEKAYFRKKECVKEGALACQVCKP